MSELQGTYIDCGSGNQAFCDCLVVQHGAMIRLVGQSQMDFAPGDAKKLAYAILDLLPDPYRDGPLTAFPVTSESGDAIVDEVREMLLARSKLGQEKYGTTLMRNDLSLLDWMRYAVEEGLDRILYMQRALKDLEKLYDDGR
jgi:hypothetical protein